MNVRKVGPCGTFGWKGEKIFLSEVLGNEPIGLPYGTWSDAWGLPRTKVLGYCLPSVPETNDWVLSRCDLLFLSLRDLMLCPGLLRTKVPSALSLIVYRNKSRQGRLPVAQDEILGRARRNEQSRRDG